jgi:hypothetical protein
VANKKIFGRLRTAFVLHFIISGAVGLQHLLFPRMWTNLAGMVIIETVTWRLIGAALIAFAISSLLASRHTSWEGVRILVIMEIVWSVLAALVIIWGIVVEGLAPLEWINVVILAVFALVFIFFYLHLKNGPQSEPG